MSCLDNTTYWNSDQICCAPSLSLNRKPPSKPPSRPISGLQICMLITDKDHGDRLAIAKPVSFGTASKNLGASAWGNGVFHAASSSTQHRAHESLEGFVFHGSFDASRNTPILDLV
jgi:hypothetical protein